MENVDYTGTANVSKDGRVYLTESLGGEKVRIAAETVKPDDPEVRIRNAAKQVQLAMDDLDGEPDSLLMALGFTEDWLAEHSIEGVQERAVEAIKRDQEGDGDGE